MITVLCCNAGIDRTYAVDSFQLGGYHVPRRLRAAPGGKGINVARVLHTFGETVVLGGLISSAVTSIKNKVPMLGDLPLLGQLFQSQSKTTTKRNLMIFVTATIVDPAGNRVHSDDELPFAQSSIPSQPPGAGQVKETVKEVHSLPPANP